RTFFRPVEHDQNASGDLGVYDTKTKTITLTGNVVISQGKNVVRGERVVVDTTTGDARVESGVIAEGTRKLLGNLFELEDLGARDLKGITGPVRAWTALRPSGVESRFEALRTVTTPLVGRDEEVDLLVRRWEQAKRGDGWAVLISGEPGIGKPRIAE